MSRVELGATAIATVTAFLMREFHDDFLVENKFDKREREREVEG